MGGLNSYKIDSKMIINAFNEIPDEQGVPTLRKFMQLFKNLQSLYLFSINKKFAEDLKTNHIAEEMINEFHKNGHLLSKRSIIIREGKFRWKIANEQISYIVRGKGNLKVCLSLGDDTKREADIYINSMEILDGCYEVFMRKFERHNFITQLHWLLKDLKGIGDPYSHLNLAGYLIGKIPPEKIINWMKDKDTRIGELRFILRAARFTSIDVNGKILNLYFDFYKKLIDYDLAKKLFNNERTTLYDIAITSKFSNEILAEHFFNYSLENDFLEKISRENNLYRINETIDLIMTNSALTQYQKNSIISKIIDKFKFEYKIFRNTEQVAQKIGKTIDLEFEKKRFIEFRKKLKIDENEVVPLLKI